MKKTVLHNMVTVTALLAAISYVGTASAHSANGALKAGAGSVDVYQTTCSKGTGGATGKFLTKVKAATKGVLVSIQASKGKLASHTTDALGGNAAYSPDAIIKSGGEGVYTILVDKSGTGPINYVLEAHCQTASGAHSGQTEPVQVQNQ
ncbi:hypothetical protein [Crenothrix sp.]|uniref:hypothetical protein n=1 Tax=Crenothrix sp. TaxID=3100433 RepID=UPI00374D8B3B